MSEEFKPEIEDVEGGDMNASAEDMAAHKIPTDPDSSWSNEANALKYARMDEGDNVASPEDVARLTEIHGAVETRSKLDEDIADKFDKGEIKKDSDTMAA